MPARHARNCARKPDEKTNNVTMMALEYDVFDTAIPSGSIDDC
jgi:hypothetical protein